jgi:hypothetical protein
MSAHTVSVRCQSCGSPLGVADDVRFVTCGYCNSELEILRDHDTVHSRAIGEMKKQITEANSRLKVMEIKMELERLEKIWEEEKLKYMVIHKNGSMDRPDDFGINALPMAMGALGLVCFIASFITEGVLALPGVCLLVGATWAYFDLKSRAAALRKSETLYLATRRRLEERAALAREEA